MLDPRVETFLTVCETMNFTKAASLLHITQPAVSQQVRRWKSNMAESCSAIKAASSF